jgi:monoamine oxidase
VIIVGAGAAGLYAAFELNGMGFNVKVLEAQDHHGGRVTNDGGAILGTTPLDFCAEAVTGNKKANWHYGDIKSLDNNRLVNAFPDNGSQTTIYNLDGNRTTGWDAGKKDFPELFDYWDFYYNADEYTGPDVDAETGICSVTGICPGSPYWHLYDAGYPGGEFATSPHTMGMRSLAIQEGLWVIGTGEFGFTNSTWLETLEELYFTQPILDLVQLNSVVTDIDTSVSPAEVTVAGVGTPFTADAVLVTVPIGVLQAGDIAFTPALSTMTGTGSTLTKQDAINLIEAGNGGKYFLKFSSTVWGGGVVGIHTPGIAGYCWASSWYKDNSANDVLTCFTMGDNATALTGMNDDPDPTVIDEQIGAILAALDNMHNPKQGATQFTDAFVSGFWARGTERPHQLGTYSSPKIGSYPTDGSPSAREVLAEQVGTSLYFAGEATHNEHSATVFGALDTGLRAAAEIDADHTPQ